VTRGHYSHDERQNDKRVRADERTRETELSPRQIGAEHSDITV
jgi:hypothetical protein